MNRLLLLTIMLLGLGACGGGDNHAEPEDTRVEFNQFVLDEFQLTDRNDEPAEINDITFRFDDDDTAFDSVL